MVLLSQDEQLAQLIGTWKLKSCSTTREDGTLARPYGGTPEGVILYTPEGWMSCHMAFGGDEDTHAPSQLYSSYHGAFTINTATSVVTHHVKGASEPDMVGTDQARSYRRDGPTLFLTAKYQGLAVEVVWVRLPGR